MESVQGLDAYIDEIQSVPLLSVQRERELARRIIYHNDAAAREELVRANLRLVVKLAKHYVKRGLSLQDLVEEGNLGLLKAADRFNPQMNIRFSSYAAWWIRQALRRALLNCVPHIHVPRYMVALIAQWKQVAAQIHEECGRPARMEEIAARMDLPARKARILRRAMESFRACNQAGLSTDGEELQPELEDVHTPAPESAVLDKDQLGIIGRLLRGMETREAQIVRMRFGLDGASPLTLSEVGQKMNLTRERVRQLEKEALEKLNCQLSERVH